MIKCIECGLCRDACPVFKTVRRESVAPRGFAILEKKENYHKMFYLCTLCNNCRVKCPYDVDLKLGEIRVHVAKEGKATEKILEIIENLRETGNPYGVKPGLDI